jgi:rhamnosyl/mannosyltransferase
MMQSKDILTSTEGNGRGNMEWKKKVLHIVSYYPPHIGGIEQIAINVVNSLNDYEHTVICFHDKGVTEIEMQGSVKVIRAATKWKIASQPVSFQFGKILRKLMRTEAPDYVHFHFPNPLAAWYLLKHKSGIKVIVHWHSDIIKQKFLKKFFKWQTVKLLNVADKIIATSRPYAEKSEFLPLFKGKTVLIHNCINEAVLNLDVVNKVSVAKIKSRYEGKIICLFVGRHVPYKGVEYLIQGLPYISKNVQLLIAGHGLLTEKLERMADGDGRIEFLGRLAQSDLVNYLAACDIFTFPSITKNEAFGIALAEAMYFGKPAVTFDIPGSGVTHVSPNGITGIECTNKNSKEFAEAINKLAADEGLRKKLGANAHERVRSHFLFDGFKTSINDLYNSLDDGMK